MATVTLNLSVVGSRRDILLKSIVIAGGAAVVASGASPAFAAPTKMAQKAASYQATPKGAARCDACVLF